MSISAGNLSLILISACLVAISACAGADNESGQSTKPVVNITSPTSSSNIAVGQEVLVTFDAADVKGLNQVELVIDGQPVFVEKIEPPVNSYSASHRWRAQTAGNHVIEFRAFNIDNLSSDPVQVFLLVADAVAKATPTNIPIQDTPTATVVPSTPTVPPTPSLTPTATETPQSVEPAIVTAVVRLNVRVGPSTQHSVLGQLNIGQTARITGRDEFSNWWQIEFQSELGDRGWVAASSEFSTAVNTDGVPVVQAPPPENRVTSTPTSVPPTPTPTPIVLKPTIFSFTADRYSIVTGERVVLSWDLANARAAFLRYDNVEEGVAAPGSKTITLDETTKFVLAAVNDAGETTAELIINVSDTAPTPVPILRDGKIRIANGQYIDFDQGLVQAGANPDADFLWDGQAQQFFPQAGASGTILSLSYNDITFNDCQTANYDEPIADVDGSAPVAGCYVTNKGHYGKFIISEWDFAANLTVEWQTWTKP